MTHLGIYILLTVILLTGCMGVSTPPPSLASEITQTDMPLIRTATVAPTVAASLTPTFPDQVSTPTLARILPFSTPPTPTIIPTLSADEARMVMLDWLQNNGGCRLPCIWGLTPGVTDTQTRREHLARFGSGPDYPVGRSDEQRNPGAIGYGSLTADNLHVSFGLNYNEVNGIIESLVLVTQPMRDEKIAFGDPYYDELLGYYRLPQLLSNYGPPSDVLIATWSYEPMLRADYEPFIVVVIYSDLGIMAEYVAPKELVNDAYRGCPTQGYLTLRTWDPESGISLKKIASMGAAEGISENAYDYFRPIEEATSMTLDEFYQTFKNPDTTACLETPADIWPRP